MLLILILFVVIPFIIGLAMFGIVGALIFGLILGPLLWFGLTTAMSSY